MWKRPSVPLTGCGWVRNEAASPVNCGARSIPATAGLGAAAVRACAEPDIAATAISASDMHVTGAARRSLADILALPCPATQGLRVSRPTYTRVRRAQDCDRIMCDANSILLLSR